MSTAVRDLVDAAKGGRPVYISTVRERLDRLDAAASFQLTARSTASTQTTASTRSPCRSSHR
jgi:hypothetical protein